MDGGSSVTFVRVHSKRVLSAGVSLLKKGFTFSATRFANGLRLGTRNHSNKNWDSRFCAGRCAKISVLLREKRMAEVAQVLEFLALGIECDYIKFCKRGTLLFYTCRHICRLPIFAAVL